jgi:hypothetical protein
MYFAKLFSQNDCQVFIWESRAEVARFGGLDGGRQRLLLRGHCGGGYCSGWWCGDGHCGDGLQEPGGVGDPLFGPAPFIAVIAGLKIDTTAISISFFTGDAIRNATFF